MKKIFFLLALVAMSVLSLGQDNQLVWSNGRLLYGTPVADMDSLTFDEMEDVDTLHLLLPRTLVKVVHDTLFIQDTIIQTQVAHDTVYVEMDCGDDAPSSSIGVFSVSAYKQVAFSHGNLQYTQSTNTWSFAENQWDMIGTDNVRGDSVSSNPFCKSKEGTALADKIDLFGWSTSKTTAPFGLSTSTDYDDYYGSFVDWGVNEIGNDAPFIWRTLTSDEWEYLLNTRDNASSLKGVAQVNGVNGLVLLPDTWTSLEGVTFKSGFHNNAYYAEYQTFTYDQWLILESAGAVFLPASGYRYGSDVSSIQCGGEYWSATKYDKYEAYGLVFHSDEAYKSLVNRHNGYSVRLVKELSETQRLPDTPDAPTEPSNTENGHEYVDLGLSVKWATCNVGATKPEEYGDYFAWGETQPKSTYDWSTYKYCNGSETTLSKYNNSSSYGTVDNKTILENTDDAATANWGGAWRMPTKAEQDELENNCTWTWTEINSVKGYKVTSNKNGNSIFFPAAGYLHASNLYKKGYGLYWSSSLYTDNSRHAYNMGFSSDSVDWDNYSSRYYGQSVRPVCP